MRKRFIPIALGLSAFSVCGLVACSDSSSSVFSSVLSVLTLLNGNSVSTGWLSDEEDPESVQDDITVNTVDDTDIDDNTSFASSVDLSGYLPPIGNQGSYGTCTAWASAYNGRTYLYAKSQGLKTSQLSNSTIFSPAFIFQNLSSSDKNTNCDGAVLSKAIEVMVSKGVPTYAVGGTYNSTSDCDCSSSSAATTNAANYKIKSYREIDVQDVSTVKRYLSDGRVIVFGARLGDNFMYYDGSGTVESSGGYTNVGQHAYHAIVCCGYDDDRGSDGAFKIVNSWGEDWGDDGYVWVGYDYFTGGDFAQYGYVLYGTDEETTASATLAASSGSSYDLQASKTYDDDYKDDDYPEDSADPRWRTLYYDVANAGSADVTASQNWAICYLLYNAYKGSEYSVVLFDYYTDQITDVPEGTYYSYDETTSDQEKAKSIFGIEAQGYTVSNYDIPAGSTVHDVIYPEYAGYPFEWSYKLPDVTGEYYLVLMADAFGNVEESNEDNNYYFLMTSDGNPLTLENGVITSTIGNNNKSLTLKAVKAVQDADVDCQTAVTKAAPNAYSPEEITAFIRAEKKSGRLYNKAAEYRETTLVKPRRSARN